MHNYTHGIFSWAQKPINQILLPLSKEQTLARRQQHEQ